MKVKNKIIKYICFITVIGLFLPTYVNAATISNYETVAASDGNTINVIPYTTASGNYTVSAGTKIKLTNNITKITSSKSATGTVSTSSTQIEGHWFATYTQSAVSATAVIHRIKSDGTDVKLTNTSSVSAKTIGPTRDSSPGPQSVTATVTMNAADFEGYEYVYSDTAMTVTVKKPQNPIIESLEVKKVSYPNEPIKNGNTIRITATLIPEPLNSTPCWYVSYPTEGGYSEWTSLGRVNTSAGDITVNINGRDHTFGYDTTYNIDTNMFNQLDLLPDPFKLCSYSQWKFKVVVTRSDGATGESPVYTMPTIGHTYTLCADNCT